MYILHVCMKYKLLEENLQRRRCMGQYAATRSPRTVFSMLSSQALCAGAGFQSFNSFALVTNIPYQC